MTKAKQSPMLRSTVTIIASPRPRVGKTLLARLMTAFHRHEGEETVAFDLNGGESTLARFLPGQASAASIGDVRRQMDLFDALVADDGVRKVVDLGHDAFEDFFTLAETFGFTAEAAERGIMPLVLFMLTPDRTAGEAFHSLRRRFPELSLALVHNEMFGPTPHRDRYGFGDTVAKLPLLAPALRKYIESPPFSFDEAQLASEVGIPLEAHIELQRWLRRAYHEFRAIAERAAPVAAREAAP
ncbi:MAG: hypothetical protein ACK4UO_13235 [Pseudolabrys sp.]